MNKSRLLRLARFLEQLPVKAFDIGAWQSKAQKRREGKRPGECGFVGCAVGWAAHEKLVPGLSFAKNGLSGRARMMEIKYGDLEGFDAAAAAFDLDGGNYSDGDAEVDFLFGAGAYESEPYFGQPTAFDVARRIRQFVNRGGRPTITL